MRQPTAILHIGTMKTGTSSIQARLGELKPALRAEGIEYYGWPMRTSELLGNHLRKSPPERGLVVSDEGLWHFAGNERSDTVEIARLLEGYDVTIIVYFRRPDQFVEAWFRQGLRHGHGSVQVLDLLSSAVVNTRPFVATDDCPADIETPEFRERIDLKILQRLGFFERTFPSARLIVRPYESSQLSGADAVEDFFVAAGLGELHASVSHASGRSNTSLTADGLLVASLLRKKYGADEKVISDILDGLGPPQRDTKILTLAEAQAINDQMRPVFRTVQERWGGGACDEFFTDWEINPSVYRTSGLREVYDAAMKS